MSCFVPSFNSVGPNDAERCALFIRIHCFVSEQRTHCCSMQLNFSNFCQLWNRKFTRDTVTGENRERRRGVPTNMTKKLSDSPERRGRAMINETLSQQQPFCEKGYGSVNAARCHFISASDKSQTLESLAYIH